MPKVSVYLFLCLNPVLPALVALDGENMLSTTSQLTINFLYPVTVTGDLMVSPEGEEECMTNSTGKSVTINCLGLTGGMEYYVTLVVVINANGNSLPISINTVFTGIQPDVTIPGNDTDQFTNNVTSNSSKNSMKIPSFSSTKTPTFKSTGVCIHVFVCRRAFVCGCAYHKHLHLQLPAALMHSHNTQNSFR